MIFILEKLKIDQEKNGVYPENKRKKKSQHLTKQNMNLKIILFMMKMYQKKIKNKYYNISYHFFGDISSLLI